MPAGDELDDIQALVRSGFGSLGAARYILLRVAQADRARAWLGTLAPTRASQVGGTEEITRVLQIAFTCAGLQQLGFGADLESFAPEFLDGMAGDPRPCRLWPVLLDGEPGRMAGGGE